MNLRKMMFLAMVVIATMLTAACGGGSYPAGPVTMMVPFRAGGGTDTQGRVIAAEMEAVLGQPINVINNTGAGGTVGVQELLASEADGQSIGFVVSSALTTSPILQGLEYTPEDVRVLGIAGTFQIALVVGGDGPDSWEEWVAFAKENPGQKYMFLGPDARLIMQQIAEQEGLELDYVAADGGAAIAPALLAGDIDIAFSGGIHSRFLETGEMKVLLNLNSTGDLMATPGLPTSADLYGVSNDVQSVLVVPADTPDDVADALSAAFETAVESDAYAETMANIQFPVTYSGPADAQAALQAQHEAFAANQ